VGRFEKAGDCEPAAVKLKVYWQFGVPCP